MRVIHGQIIWYMLLIIRSHNHANCYNIIVSSPDIFEELKVILTSAI